MTNKIPKTRQILFFVTPEETSKLLEFILDLGLIIYYGRSTTVEPFECKSFEDIGQVFICPCSISDQINTYKINNEVHAIDRTTSPVIEMDCSILRTNGLFSGRIYFRGGYDGREGWVAYPEILYESFKKIESFMKKTLLTKEREYGAYVSKGALSYVSSGGCLRQ